MDEEERDYVKNKSKIEKVLYVLVILSIIRQVFSWKLSEYVPGNSDADTVHGAGGY